jgi:hypothetical protein
VNPSPAPVFSARETSALARTLALAILAPATGLAGESGPAEEPRAPTDLQLFLVFGIPNLPPRGAVDPIDRELHRQALVMNKGFGWSRAIDPEAWTAGELAHLELAAALARTTANGRPEWRAGLVPAAFGGKSLDDWMPGTPLYRGAVERMKIAQKDGKLVGMLWYQGPTGEDPAKAKEYAKRFGAMITQLRADLGVKYVPVIVGEINLGAKGAALATPLAQVPQEVIPCFFVSTEGLVGAPEAKQLDSKMLWEYSDRFAQAWADLAQP